MSTPNINTSQNIEAFDAVYQSIVAMPDSATSGDFKGRLYLHVDHGTATTTLKKSEGTPIGKIVDLAQTLINDTNISGEAKNKVTQSVYYMGMIDKGLGPTHSPEEISDKLKDPEIERWNQFVEENFKI